MSAEEVRRDPLGAIVDGIREAGLDYACLYLMAFQFSNEHCFAQHGGKRCELCPPKPGGGCAERLPECVHKYLVDKIGVDLPAIQPRRTQ